MSSEIKCVISGPFKEAKSQIDQARDCFEDYGIKVLSPGKGGWHLPADGKLWFPDTFPLKSEINLNEIEARKHHFKSISAANFLYICCGQNGRVGNDVAMEMGVAWARNIVIYSDQPISPELDDDPKWRNYLKGVKVDSPEAVAKYWQNPSVLRQLWLPKGYILLD